MAAKHFNDKSLLSGNILEMYHYERTYYFDVNRKDTLKSESMITEEMKAVNKTKALDRAIKEVRRYIASNYTKNTTKFITLGFKEEVTILSEAKKKLDYFHKKLNRILNISPKYIGTYEYQDNGKIHFHIIYFNLPYIEHEELSRIWNNGSAYIQSVEDGPASYNYLTKYILKSNTNREDNRNMYFRSLKLNKPIEKNDDLVAQKINKILDSAEFKWFYNFKNENEYAGEYTVKSIDIRKLDTNIRMQILRVLK